RALSPIPDPLISKLAARCCQLETGLAVTGVMPRRRKRDHESDNHRSSTSDHRLPFVMSLVVTEATVLHVFDYLESSRIFRLVTREAGVRSVLARGARRSTRRFGSALDLFAQGTAQLHVKPGRDLDTLGGFDVERARPALAADLARFTGAAVIAELTLRFGRDAADLDLYTAATAALDDLAEASTDEAREATLAGAW